MLTEETFRIVVEAAPNAKVVVDASRTIRLANQSAERLFGYDRGELLGRSLELLVPERSRERHVEHVTRFHAAPAARPMGAGRDLHGRRKDGTEVPIEIGLTPIDTAEGTFTLASIIDITERKRAEELSRVVVEAAPNAILMVDDDRRVVLANERAESLFGYTRAELVGLRVDALVPERFREAHAAHVGGFFARPEARMMGAGRALFALRRDGSEVAVEIGLSPVVTPRGRFTLAAIIDITERKRVEDELRRSNTELEQFAYVASHDLQEPLRMVASYTELLGERYRGRLDEKADKYIHYAVDGAKRMQRLINDLLAYSRVGSQGKPLVAVDAGQVVADAIRVLGPSIRAAGATVEVDALPTVLADEGQLQQLFANLLSNAIKFRGDAPPRVQVTARRDGVRWVLSVRDNGIGLDVKYAERVFQMFQRLHDRGAYEGSGIGLAIARRIVERHGGQLWYESAPGAGATFSFTLRAAPAQGGA